jgi:ABC-type bacteriocin/lantibiotic exporter with double-glycine peptidase domain
LGEGDQWRPVVVTSFLLQALALAAPAFSGAIIDRVVPRADYHLLTVLCCGFAAAVLFGAMASLVRAHLLLQLRTYVDVRLAVRFVEHLMTLPFAFFQQRAQGDLLMRLSSNSAIREILTSGVASGLIDGTLVFLYLIVIMIVNPAVGAAVLALGVTQIVVLVTTRVRQRELMAESLQTQARTQSYQFEMLSGIATLKSMGAEQHAIDHWMNLFVNTTNVSLERGRLAATVEAVMSTVRQLSPLVVLATGTVMVLDGAMSLGTAVALNALSAGFLGPLSNLVATAGQFQLLGAYVERIRDVLLVEPEQDGSQVVEAGDLKGRIEVQNLSFRYGPAAPLALKDVSVTIQPGQFVAIVGPSGSGKSTLASIILALYKPTEGRVLFDGRDIAGLNLGSLRRQLGIVLQKSQMFSGSLRSNIALGEPGASLEAVAEAARAAQLYDDVTGMPLGFDTILGENWGTVSGGQAQRVSLARALLRKPAILLLDEATSALDAVTELKVQQALEKLECTRIVIAHRLSTIAKADLILVMVDGRIVERGRHDDLVAHGGQYSALVRGQLAPRAEAQPSP